MSELALDVQGISKRYYIGGRVEAYRTFRDALTETVSAPFRRIAGVLRGQTHAASNAEQSFWALQDVSFQVKPGEAIGIIGRNGAGKSTLLKILSQITEPTKGRAAITGRIGSLLEVGTGFHQELTGRENIFLNGAILGMTRSEIASKFDEIVAFAEVDKFIDTPVKHYSSGMYLRLAFAVAAHLEPEILLVDEVLAVGDVVFQRKCLGKMSEVSGQGRTVLFVSHNMGAISNLCRRTICLDKGRIIDDGDTEAVVRRYLERTNAELPQDGYVDLSRHDRGSWLAERHSQLNWVRLSDGRGRQSGVFAEGDPITVEVGFSLGKQASIIQLGCVVSINSSELFTVPSPEYDSGYEPGDFETRMRIAPNYLRDGGYEISLKLFVDGIRQDTLSVITRFQMVSNLSADDTSAYLKKWVSGPLRFDYGWDPLAKTTQPAVESGG
ncbi:MAG: ABC transporter ATP-binding protein [Anaerolinea sp.]|nr:ABC transporter ATP-binding protein [Anaerolinea sp.]MCC6973429.1 ABC transporter ATP-binding protein [Anaerolineae bacterium]CAG1009105.1 Teichoic acids export ATP-binding protein TagH [Anaerolineae bacterium]